MLATLFSRVFLQRVVRRTPDTHCTFGIDWSLTTSAIRCVSTAGAASHSDIRCNTYRTCECASPAECTDIQQRIIRVSSLQLWQESRAISHENTMTVSQRRALEVIHDVLLDPYQSQAAHVSRQWFAHVLYVQVRRALFYHVTPCVIARWQASRTINLRTYAVRHLKVSLGTSRNCTMDSLNTNSSLCIRTVTYPGW